MTGTRTSVEDAVGVVRLALPVLSVVTIVTVGPQRAARGAVEPIAVSLVLVLVAAMVAAASRRLLRRGTGDHRSVAVVHALDVGSLVAISVAVQTYVADAAWALLAVPIVLASVRLGERAVVATWILASAAYVVLLRLVGLDRSIDAPALAGRIGVLLAVAAALAVLARWLQEGWQNQSEMTRSAERRIERLATIESAARAMRTESLERIPAICVDHVVRLGFDAATAIRGGRVVAASGREGFAPTEAFPDEARYGEVHIAPWTDGTGGEQYSARTLEPFSKTTITGWSRHPIDEASAYAVHDLVANTTSAMEAAHHLERVRHQATHDPLTDLANRAVFHRLLDRASGRSEPLAVVFIDLDNFKAVNDDHGHDVGDKFLIIVARRIAKAVGEHGLVARLGGDEFAVLLTGPAARYAGPFGQDLAVLLRAVVAVDGLELPASASIGVATRTGPTDPAELVKEADTAAYAAKAAGRDNAQIFDHVRT